MNYRFQLSISAVSSLVFVLLLNCSYASHQVAPGYELGWANYEIDTKVAKFPGKIPGKGVGRFYKINDFLNRASARERTGIYITEPYDPDKIPVLFVHGLICDPYAWEKMTKRLSRDPVIRENYQFWYYAYPSATPVIGSAAIFKLHLDTYIDALKEEHGHSLDVESSLLGTAWVEFWRNRWFRKAALRFATVRSQFRSISCYYPKRSRIWCEKHSCIRPNRTSKKESLSRLHIGVV